MRKSGRSVFLLFAGIVACANLSVSDSLAQSYPVKPVRILVGFVPGGAVDIIARLIGQKLSETLGQPVVIENRPGASTAIATDRAAKSPADGYTLLLIAISTAIQSALRTNLPYDLKRDLAPVSLVSIGPFVLVVHPSLPARNVKELIALARSHPGKLSVGSPGVGSAPHLAGELFKSRAKINVVHVPYKGSADSVVGAASGLVPVCFASLASALPLLDAGRLRPLAVTTAKRASLLPSTPTLDESGLPGYDYSAWYGVSAPAGVPKDIIARLAAVLGKVVPEIRESLNKQGLEPRTSTPDEFAAMIHREIAQTTKLIELTGLKAE
jgi:tripartite-type tricarboxylate transporter receptor subunit TctC